MRTRLAACFTFFYLGSLAVAAFGQEARPNIVVLYADDAGYADFGFQPDAARDLVSITPHIDSIAKNGARFSNAYMSGAVCSPSRAGLLTGRYQQRFGHERNIPPGYMKGGMSLDEQTIANRLAELGVATGLVGKWHLGYPPEYHPNKRGFDWFFGLLQGSRGYYAKDTSAHRTIQENGKMLPEVGYVTDRFGDAAARFIDEHAQQPFFLFVSFTAPHGPLQAKESDLELLANIEPIKRRKYAGLVKSLDDAVGVVLASLEKNDLLDRTLLVFTNDNGGQTLTGANNFPLRGRKGDPWEGGVRVPMAMQWPGHIQAGSVIDDAVSSLDFLPTFVALHGGKIDPAWQLDGIDLTDRLTGKVSTLPARKLYWRTTGSGGNTAMRHGNYKLVVERGKPETHGQVHLFDLAKDLSESNNLASQEPERVKQMLAALEAWEAELMEPLWGNGPKPRFVADSSSLETDASDRR